MFRKMLLTLLIAFGLVSIAQEKAEAQKPTATPTTKTQNSATYPELPQPKSEYRFDYGANKNEVITLSFRGGRTRVLLPRKFDSIEFRKTIETELKDAYLCIEPLGCAHAPLTICVVESIHPSFPIKQSVWKVFGLTFEHDGAYHIAIVKENFRFDCIAHELCHLRLSELGYQYPWWLEEGISECFESWTYADAGHLEALRNKRSASRDELVNYKPLQGNEEGIRATAWAIAYYLFVIKKTPLKDLAKAESSLDPKVAIAAVLKTLP